MFCTLGLTWRELWQQYWVRKTIGLLRNLQQRVYRLVRLRSLVYMLTQERQVSRSKTVGGCLGLVPERVDQRQRAHLIEASALLFCELQLGGLEVVGQLFVGTSADYHRGHTRSA